MDETKNPHKKNNNNKHGEIALLDVWLEMIDKAEEVLHSPNPLWSRFPKCSRVISLLEGTGRRICTRRGSPKMLGRRRRRKVEGDFCKNDENALCDKNKTTTEVSIVSH